MTPRLPTMPRLIASTMSLFDHPLQLNAEPLGAFIQDSDGFLWIGTKSGLIKYNGMDTQVYKQAKCPQSRRQGSSWPFYWWNGRILY